MIGRILASAAIAGLTVGILTVALQTVFVTPLILEGELYETGARVHFATDGITQSPAGAPSALAEPGRLVSSFAMGIVVETAFALLLVAAFAIAARFGKTTDARTGMIWGLAAFVTLHLAPAAGLAPELPGMIAAEVGARQAWWAGTVIATGAGIALIAFGKGWLPVAGVALVALPHLIGAPHLDTYFGVAPPELSAHFAARSLAAAAASWVALGALAGWLWHRGEADQA